MSSASSASSASKDYKKTAQKLTKKVKALEEEMKGRQAHYDAECDKHTKTLNEKKAKMKTLLEERNDLRDRLTEAEGVINTLQETTKTQNPMELLDWVKTQAERAEANQVQADALRMFGELQVKFNLLEEQMAVIRRDGYKVSKNKKEKGLSSEHRKEHIVQANHLPLFVSNRCSALVYSNGKGCQCSRHWDSKQNPDGKDTHLCLTHNKLLVDGVFTGSTGLYHQERPARWGEYGLSVQKEYKTGGKISWKMPQCEWNTQFNSPEFQASIPADVPKFPYPKLDVQVSDDEDDDASVMSVSTGASSQTEEFPADVANLADVETGSEADMTMTEEEAKGVEDSATEEEQADEDPVEEEQVIEEPVVWAKQAQLDRLEKMNQGAIAVDYDILCDLREEKAEWEAEQAQVKELAEMPSDEEEEFECFACAGMFPATAVHHPYGPDDDYCFECARQAEYDQQNTNKTHLVDSDEE